MSTVHYILPPGALYTFVVHFKGMEQLVQLLNNFTERSPFQVDNKKPEGLLQRSEELANWPYPTPIKPSQQIHAYLFMVNFYSTLPFTHLFCQFSPLQTN
jgi:hypothetical protein